MAFTKGVVSTKRNGFHQKELLPLKEMAFTKKMPSTKKNGFHEKKYLLLKGMASTKGNGFH